MGEKIEASETDTKKEKEISKRKNVKQSKITNNYYLVVAYTCFVVLILILMIINKK